MITARTLHRRVLVTRVHVEQFVRLQTTNLKYLRDWHRTVILLECSSPQVLDVGPDGVSDSPSEPGPDSLGVGLGVRTGEQAAEIAGFADAVIVGSAFVSAGERGGPDAAGELAAELAAGIRSVRRVRT